MLCRCYSSEEQLKLVRVAGVGVFGVGFCGETFEVGNFGGNFKLEFSLDISVPHDYCEGRIYWHEGLLDYLL
jgi:hypothetical protein